MEYIPNFSTIFTEAHWIWWMEVLPDWMHVFAVIGGFWFYCEKIALSIAMSIKLLLRRE